MTIGSVADYATLFSVAITLIIWIYSFRTWIFLKKKEDLDNTLIKIKLQVEEKKSYTFRYNIRRKYLSRAEVMGLLGMIPMKNEQKRFTLNYTNHIEFLDAISTAQDNKNCMILTIQCTPKELEQFDIKKLEQLTY